MTDEGQPDFWSPPCSPLPTLAEKSRTRRSLCGPDHSGVTLEPRSVQHVATVCRPVRLQNSYFQGASMSNAPHTQRLCVSRKSLDGLSASLYVVFRFSGCCAPHLTSVCCACTKAEIKSHPALCLSPYCSGTLQLGRQSEGILAFEFCLPALPSVHGNCKKYCV